MDHYRPILLHKENKIQWHIANKIYTPDTGFSSGMPQAIQDALQGAARGEHPNGNSNGCNRPQQRAAAGVREHPDGGRGENTNARPNASWAYEYMHYS